MPLPKAKEYALEFVRGLRTGQRTTDPVAHLNRLSIQEEPDEGTPNPELMEEASDYKGVIETCGDKRVVRCIDDIQWIVQHLEDGHCRNRLSTDFPIQRSLPISGL